jgi:hypothetical protein
LAWTTCALVLAHEAAQLGEARRWPWPAALQPGQQVHLAAGGVARIEVRLLDAEFLEAGLGDRHAVLAAG